MFKNITKILVFIILFSTPSFAETIKDIKIQGNSRIPNETIKMFIGTKIGNNVNNEDLNNILKNIYNSNFFENVKVNLNKGELLIEVVEYPLIENVNFKGIKADRITEEISANLELKNRRSFNKVSLNNDREKILNKLKMMGYFFSTLEVNIENLEDNKINLEYVVTLGEKSKIRKITFLGNDQFKDKKLKSLIISEEYKFWKFLSGKKFLNQEFLNLDQRLLKNFYLNKGFYDVKINASFAKLTNENEFELIYNIDENKKFYFDKTKLALPVDFDQENFKDLNKFINEIKGEPYSINIINNIIEKIEEIVLEEEYRSIEATVNEDISENKINLIFQVVEGEKFVVDRINIFGNNITQENVIRNQLLIDEGDIYNSILSNKSINNIKALNIFKKVDSKILTNEIDRSKTMEIYIEEKPTGEIMAGAGVGTDGTMLSFAVKENNYLGRGIKLKSELNLSEERIDGIFSFTNPNFRNSDKSINANIQATEIDRLSTSGYKSKKSGFGLGTNFEYQDDLFLGINQSSYYETIDTDGKASSQLKKQQGNYFDTFINFNFDYDKRNQKFQTTDGFRNFYSLGLPLISESNTLTNSFNSSYYTELYENNITKFSINLSAANSITNDDIKLSERIFIPASKLRGFEAGKVGPKDGTDFIGGNFSSTINISSTLPYIFKNSQNLDALFFTDIGNVWGVDYSSSIEDSNKIRSSVGIGVDWFTPVGPLNFSLAAPLTKANTDKTQNFRFNLGTTF